MRSAQHYSNRSTCSRFQIKFRRLIYRVLPLHRANWTSTEFHTLTARLLLFLRCLWRFNCIISNNFLFSFFWFPLFRVDYALTRCVTQMLRELVPHTREHMRSMWLYTEKNVVSVGAAASAASIQCFCDRVSLIGSNRTNTCAPFRTNKMWHFSISGGDHANQSIIFFAF